MNVKYELLHLPRRLDLLEKYIKQNHKSKKIILCIGENANHKFIEDELNTDDYKINIIGHISEVHSNKEANLLYVAKINLQQSFVIDDLHYLAISNIYENTAMDDKLKKILEEVNGLEKDDYIVHKKYGVGQFLGLERTSFGDIEYDCIKLLYANNNRLLLPIDNINLISKYKNKNNNDTELDDIVSKNWETRKARVKNKIQELALKIIETQAKRNLATVTPIQLEEIRDMLNNFYSDFEYVETTDQTKATIDIENDLISGKPMNRLICGDVGFGKTEIAMRAMFMIAISKKLNLTTGQVAVIAPTTFLAKQLFHSVQNRLGKYVFNIKLLSRFSTTKEQKDIESSMTNGTLDILISTHAAFTKGNLFKNLELLIIDEEQSFGVEQKEKIKKHWPHCHSLYLSATPIPRTFQATLYGILDTSIIATAPQERITIKHYISTWKSEVIEDAINKELARDGRIVFLTPRIEDIPHILSKLKAINIEKLKVNTITGKMDEEEVEVVMNELDTGKTNCLIATTILAQGMNINKLNTIIICDADRFGLGQLYQIRGRVGRSNIQGYVYFIVNKNRITEENVINRLKVINSATFLGGGFAIANADLDMRGGGNIIGKEQSGNIKEVGFDLYQEMLANEIQRTGDGTNTNNKFYSYEIETQTNVFIPDNYIKDPNIRLSFYRQFSRVHSMAQWCELQNELTDRFGSIPDQIKALEGLVKLREVCCAYNIKHLRENKNSASFSFYEQVKIDIPKLLSIVQSSDRNIAIKNNSMITLFFKEKQELYEKLHFICSEIVASL